ncbi:hypothetical protein [Paracoccus sp. (in: a-proteobacteria)]|uniref:hypothetical protein n=1 Tax=Paracoccus sp. TaxID=267 RepID=UPI00396C7FFB
MIRAGPEHSPGLFFPANVHDQLALGNMLRVPSIVDTPSRSCCAADPRFICRREDVVRTLERFCGRTG